MKFSALIACVLLAFTWCCSERRSNKETPSGSALSLRYFKDKRTGLCFAVDSSALYHHGGNVPKGIAGYLAHVPCDPVVRAGLLEE